MAGKAPRPQHHGRWNDQPSDLICFRKQVDHTPESLKSRTKLNGRYLQYTPSNLLPFRRSFVLASWTAHNIMHQEQGEIFSTIFSKAYFQTQEPFPST